MCVAGVYESHCNVQCTFYVGVQGSTVERLGDIFTYVRRWCKAIFIRSLPFFFLKINIHEFFPLLIH